MKFLELLQRVDKPALGACIDIVKNIPQQDIRKATRILSQNVGGEIIVENELKTILNSGPSTEELDTLLSGLSIYDVEPSHDELLEEFHKGTISADGLAGPRIREAQEDEEIDLAEIKTKSSATRTQTEESTPSPTPILPPAQQGGWRRVFRRGR